MDDICDSVETVEKVQKQTEDIDMVLASGGFKKSRNGHPIKPKRATEMTIWK